MLEQNEISNFLGSINQIEVYDKIFKDGGFKKLDDFKGLSPEILLKNFVEVLKIGLGSSNSIINELKKMNKISSNTELTTSKVIPEIGQDIPIGLICLWSGETIPKQWALCDGMSHERSDKGGIIKTPYLRDRFIICSGKNYQIAATGGLDKVKLDVSQTPAHCHTGTTDESGAHIHDFSVWAYAGWNEGPTPHQLSYRDIKYDHLKFDFKTEKAGNHKHNVKIDSIGGSGYENMPPYYGLAFIMKI